MMEQLIQLMNGGTIAMIAIATFVVVWGIKQTPLNNKYLPLIALVIGAVFGLGFGAVNGDVQPVVGLVDGLVAGAVSVGGNELAKSIGTMFNGGAK